MTEHVHQLSEDDVSGPPPGTQTVTRLTDDLAPRYQAALNRHAHGELIRFELFMFPLPTEHRDPEGNHQIIGMLGLFIEIKGAVLNTQISATRVMQPNGHTDDVIDAHVRETIEGLLGARSQQLRQQAADSDAARAHGQPPPVSGMIQFPETGSNLTFDDMERAMNGFARGE